MFRNTTAFGVVAALVGGCSSGSPAATYQSVPDASTHDASDAAAAVDSPEEGDDGGSEASTGSGVPLPFYLSDQFVPTGFMGDSMASMTAITLAHDTTTCKSPRMSGAGGDCFTATWAPTISGPASAWAGVYWQSPPNNWGALPGKAIQTGATKVTFYAAGAQGGETIQVCAGGINYNASSATLPNADTFSVKIPAVTLTTSWTQYEISLQGASYEDVLGGFCWVSTATTSESITFYIDDIQWQ